MIRHFVVCTLLTSSIAATSAALAHGPQLQVTTSGGKLVTNSIFLDEDPVNGYGPLTAEKRVYVMPLTNSLGDGQYFARPNPDPSYYSGPGFAPGLSNLQLGSEISLQFLAGLLLWDGATFADPGTEQLQAFRGGHAAPSATLSTVDGGPSGSMTVTPSFTPGAGAHNTARFRLLGDSSSPTSLSDDGVYLATMQLTSNSTSPVVAPSDPYYFLLHKNASSTVVDAALASLLSSQGIDSSMVQVVPEPSSIAIMATGGLLLGFTVVRRRQRA
ncbi:MAG: PEP-CTERM sorting domain-containing protein [Planctomycetaceae bacterium]|nr:PEP-CTERM sorting domain-containing protein [Planctomycetaceae bacterium]